MLFLPCGICFPSFVNKISYLFAPLIRLVLKEKKKNFCKKNLVALFFLLHLLTQLGTVALLISIQDRAPHISFFVCVLITLIHMILMINIIIKIDHVFTRH